MLKGLRIVSLEGTYPLSLALCKLRLSFYLNLVIIGELRHLQGRHPVNIVFVPFCKWATVKEKVLTPVVSKLFPFRVNPFPEGD